MDMRRIGIGLGAVAGGAAALVAGAFLYDVAQRQRLSRAGAGDGDAAPDLDPDKPHPGPDHRAPVAFRPDPTAPVPPSERESLAPVTGPAPSISQNRGAMNSETAPDNGLEPKA